MSDQDPTETVINIDYDRKILFGWTNHKLTIKQWLAEFPDICKVSKDGLSADINGIPLSAIKKLKVNKKVKKELTDDERQVLRDRMLKMRTKN